MKDLTEDQLTAASIAVRDAVRAYTGRVRSVDSWKGSAGQALGRKRLATRFWEAVLEHGTALQLFVIDAATYSYPVLKIVEASEEDTEESLEAVVFFDDEDDLVEMDLSILSMDVVPVDPTVLPPPPPTPPEEWNPPVYQDCGHINWGASEEEGCRSCAEKRTPSWRHLKGEFIRPIPKTLRRTKAKTDMGGFPGLCCHPETGLYIGGPDNNCRRNGDDRCEVHA